MGIPSLIGRARNAFLSLSLLLGVTALHAGMRYSAVAIDAKEVPRLEKDPKRVDAILENPGRADSIDLDKAWHGIHYLLTGTAWGKKGVLAGVILGGRDIGDDQGYGPARLLTAEEVAEIARALASETPEQLATRYDPQAMEKADIYPNIWVRDGKDGLDYLLDHYKRLRAFFLKAAKEKRAVLLVVN